MGATKVGKSSLITQFLYSRYIPKYKRTIEEMHQGNFNVAGVGLTLDILDTSGSNEVMCVCSFICFMDTFYELGSGITIGAPANPALLECLYISEINKLNFISYKRFWK